MQENSADLDPKARRLQQLLSSGVFRALCGGKRVGILSELASRREACSVSQIAECCTVDLSVVSRHLKALREAGVLRAERSGREVFYSVRSEEIVETLRDLADCIEACCPSTGEVGCVAGELTPHEEHSR